MIDCKEKGEEMLSIVSYIPYDKQAMYIFIWETIRGSRNEKENKMCDECFMKRCNAARECMGISQNAFTIYSQPKEAIKIEKEKKNQQKFKAGFSSKFISSVKKQ